MKLLYLITDWDYGGAEMQVMRISQWMKKHGYEVVLVSMMIPKADDWTQTLKDCGIEVQTLGMKKGYGDWKAVFTMLKIVKKEKPKVIHSHMFHANLLSRIVWIFVKDIKVINTVHGEEEFLGKRRWVYRGLNCMSEITVCCGKTLAEQAQKMQCISKGKLKVIYNGLDTDQYKKNDKIKDTLRSEFKLKDSDFVWISVGRLYPVKNQNYLIQEFTRLYSRFSNARLLLVGDGPDKDKLMKHVNKFGMDKAIIFTGKRNDISTFLNIADAFVLSSIHEGLPLCLQEASSIGLPLVATDVGGCREIVIDGENGFLCKSEEIGGLCKCMEKVMELDLDERTRMSAKSREIAIENFEMDTIADKWIKLYE